MKRIAFLRSLAFPFLWCTYASLATAVTLTNIYQFQGNDDGRWPSTGIIQGRDGYLYGTTYACCNGAGVVFKVSTNGAFSTLCAFPSSVDYGPTHGATLAQGTNGHLYGTTLFGPGVFDVSPDGEFQTLREFNFSLHQGLIRGCDNNFYGVTYCSTPGYPPYPSVFRITPSGTLTTVSVFDCDANGSPNSMLVRDEVGNLYGTSYSHISCDEYGVNYVDGGSIFRVNTDGSVTNLWWFSGPDGAWPASPLVRGADGNFYGRTLVGGASYSNACEAFLPPFPQPSLGYGTIFKITPSGDLTTLRSFDESDAGGDFYMDSYGTYVGLGLTYASDGNLYGMTIAGGTNRLGSIFRITTSGNFSILYQFIGTDGFYPVAQLVQGCDGSFYGVTSGYPWSNGTVFKFTVPFSATPNQVSWIRIEGTNVLVSVPSIFGADYQLQQRDSMATGTWTDVTGASVTCSVGGPIILTNFGGATSSQRFYRVDVFGCSTHTYTDPVGFITLTAVGTNGVYYPCYSQWGLGLTQIPVFRGRAATLNGRQVVLDSELIPGRYDRSTSGGATNPTHFIEFTSGPNAGLMDDIISNDIASVYTAHDNSPAVTSGTACKIYPHWTIGTVFGANNEAGLLAGSGATADQIQIWNADSQGYTASYYYKTTGPIGGTGWRSTSSISINASNTVLYLDKGVLVARKAAGDISIKLVGP